MTDDESISDVLLKAMVVQKQRVDQLEKRMKVIEGMPRCPLCFEQNTTAEAFIRHFKAKHMDLPNADDRLD